MTKLAIFASGRGSNTKKIIEYFKDKAAFSVDLIVSNKKDALVLEEAREQQIATLVLDRFDFYATHNLLQQLKNFQIDCIALAGFLWLIPEYLIQAYPNKIINIHPALLPKFGGKGMYGRKVHQAVVAAKEIRSGITIHYVNAKYDEGNILFQASCPIAIEEQAEEVARKVQLLEHQYFSPVIEAVFS
ncbi:MAG: phosphoribosylglycinamide formyltransferase [Bacteroidota bacterium]